MNKVKELVNINLTEGVKISLRKMKSERGMRYNSVIENAILNFCKEYNNRNLPKINGYALNAKYTQRISKGVYSKIWLISHETYVPVSKLIDFAVKEYLKKNKLS